MKKSAYLSDLVFIFFAVFLFTLCYLRYLRLPLLVGVLIAAMLATAAACLASFLLGRKKNKIILRKKEEEEAEKLALHLALLTPKAVADFFKNSLFRNAEIFVKKGECFGRTDKETILFKFTPTPLSAESVLPLLYESGETPCTLYCYKLSPEAKKFCDGFCVNVKTIPELYKRLQKENGLPTVYKSERAFAKKKKLTFALRFAKRNASRFFVSGSMLVLTSLLVPFPYYYLVIGGLLLLTAVVVRAFGYA